MKKNVGCTWGKECTEDCAANAIWGWWLVRREGGVSTIIVVIINQWYNKTYIPHFHCHCPLNKHAPNHQSLVGGSSSSPSSSPRPKWLSWLIAASKCRWGEKRNYELERGCDCPRSALCWLGVSAGEGWIQSDRHVGKKERISYLKILGGISFLFLTTLSNALTFFLLNRVLNPMIEKVRPWLFKN